jgi:hypothetical protein
MISLSAPQSAFSSSRKSNSTTPSGASASQQRLRSSIDQSLHYYSGLLCNEEREESDSNSTRCDSTIVSERTHAPKQKLIISLAEAEAQSTECQPLDMNFHLIHKYSIQCLIAENYTEAILLYQNILSTATVLSRKKNAKADYDAVSGMALHHLGIIFMYAEANEDARIVLQKAVELRLEVWIQTTRPDYLPKISLLHTTQLQFPLQVWL